ncbi:SDR family NAD(P)-dependent oxidoreductase [Actinophytocola sp.]|uniref:SDR family NAD(P)-dependent oxidoreductase n=1 Tax=Actinophytocola sp. TaxID=1872138 RepID=UPI003D6A08A3
MTGARTVVVTGAARGLGFATARLLAERGDNVMMLDRSDDVVAAADKLAADGYAVVGRACDITDESAVEAAALDLDARFGGCQGLVNNAGVIGFGGIEDLDLAEWERVVAVNLTGAFLCCKHFGRLMLRGGAGSIVNVTSLASSCPTPNAGAYSASKAGAEILARQLAVEWGKRGIRANALNPGFMSTPMAQPFLDVPESLAKRKEMVASGRIGEAEEVARVIEFLLDVRSSYVNGASIDVDGGLGQMLTSLVPRPGTEQSTG